jgi:hypothetical protein
LYILFQKYFTRSDKKFRLFGIKIKVVTANNMTTNRRRKSAAVLVIILASRWRTIVNIRFRLIYPEKYPLYPLNIRLLGTVWTI